MTLEDRKGHLMIGDLGLGARITEAGYEGWRRVGENVYAFGESMLHTHAGFVIDWGYDAQDFDAKGQLRPNWRALGDGLQDPAGHRELLLSDHYAEIGIAVLPDHDRATSVGPFVVTQSFGLRKAYEAQLMGVVLADHNDRFYDLGEGMGGVAVLARSEAGVFTTTTLASGGVSAGLGTGKLSADARSGGGLQGQSHHQITMTEDNQKIDVFADQVVDMPPVLSEPPRDHGLPYGAGLAEISGDLVLEGALGGQLLQGHLGNDILYGEGFGARHRLAARWASDPHSPEVMGQVHRLYQATLGRGPDPDGQIGWSKALLDGSRTLEQVVIGFTSGSEFQGSYGKLGDAGFVELLYKDVLAAPWRRVVWPAGPRACSRASAARKWSWALPIPRNSPRLLQPVVERLPENSDPASWSGAVDRLYQAALDRAPDAKGFQN